MAQRLARGFDHEQAIMRAEQRLDAAADLLGGERAFDDSEMRQDTNAIGKIPAQPALDGRKVVSALTSTATAYIIEVVPWH